MNIKGSTYFLILILAVTGFVIISSLTMKAFSSKLLPLVIGGATFILAALQLAKELKNAKTLAEGEMTATGPVWRGYLIAGVWIGGFFFSIYLLGFMIAIAWFILVYMKKHGTSWLTSMIYAGATTAAVYGLFEYLMKVELYRGIVLSIFCKALAG